MAPGAAANLNDDWAAASSLATRSPGKAAVVEAAVALVAITLSTSATHVLAAASVVTAAALVAAGAGVVVGPDELEFELHEAAVSATTVAAMGMMPRIPPARSCPSLILGIAALPPWVWGGHEPVLVPRYRASCRAYLSSDGARLGWRSSHRATRPRRAGRRAAAEASRPSSTPPWPCAARSPTSPPRPITSPAPRVLRWARCISTSPIGTPSPRP